MQFNSKQADALREKARGLATTRAQHAMELAEVLWQTANLVVGLGNEALFLYQAWGYDTWPDYVERELGMHGMTAYWYRRIHEKFLLELDGYWDKDLLQSPTKMVALTRVVNKSNANAWLRRAAKMSCCELDDAVYEHLTGHRRAKYRKLSVSVQASALDEINETIREADDDFPDAMTRGDVLVEIVKQWRSLRIGRKLKKAG